MNRYNTLANLLTGLSLLCGFISIIFSLESQFTFASWAIICSVVFDGLDGQVARKNPFPSLFGKEFDSLVDVISFGIAPSILGYVFVYNNFSFLATAALFVYLSCSVLRLAKYNITSREELADYFFGLPTTASGGILASFILIYRRSTQFPPPQLFLLLVLLLSFLMVSRVKYPNLNSLEKIFSKFTVLVLAVGFIVLLVLILFYMIVSIFLAELFVFTLFAIYLLFSPFMLKLLKS